MKYFVTDEQREGTCYNEFYKGKWDEETFWKKDSLSLHDDVLFRIDEFEKAIVRVIPSPLVKLKYILHSGKKSVELYGKKIIKKQ